MASVDVVVIGAGPYGLALAAHLRRQHIDFCLLGEPMHSWQESMPDGMFLKSEGFASNIADPDGEKTLRRFCLDSDRAYDDYAFPVPIETFRGYGKWVFSEGEFPHLPGQVVSLSREQSSFRARLDSGDEVVARTAVVATGITGLAHVPRELAALPRERLSHSSEAVDVGFLARKQTVIVGAGQSALELAALLLERGGTPRVLVRRGEVRWNPWPRPTRSIRTRLRSPRGPLGDGWRLVALAEAAQWFRYLPRASRVRIAHETLGPAGAWWLRTRVEPQGVLYLDHCVVSAESSDGGPVTLRVATAGVTKELTAEHVVAATGYRVDLQRLPFLDGCIANELASFAGAPVLSRTFESSIPGLFFVGLLAANTFGPSMRFVCGSGIAAERVSRALGQRLRSRACGPARASRRLISPSTGEIDTKLST